jgi:hypothetical protein
MFWGLKSGSSNFFKKRDVLKSTDARRIEEDAVSVNRAKLPIESSLGFLGGQVSWCVVQRVGACQIGHEVSCTCVNWC